MIHYPDITIFSNKIYELLQYAPSFNRVSFRDPNPKLTLLFACHDFFWNHEEDHTLNFKLTTLTLAFPV